MKQAGVDQFFRSKMVKNFKKFNYLALLIQGVVSMKERSYKRIIGKEERVKERTADLEYYHEKLRSMTSELNKVREHEKQQLATDLHDNLGQILAVCRMELDLLKNQLPDNTGSASIANMAELLNEAIRYTRELMSDLKPPLGLENEDIVTMMNWLANKMKKHGLEVSIEDDGRPKPLHQEVQTALLQSVKELLFNVIKHAGTTREARMKLTRLDSSVRLTIKDHGKGFDPKKLEWTQKDDGGFGLFNIYEQLNLLGGCLDIFSKPGTGTAVTLTVPLKIDPDANHKQIRLF